MTNIQDVLKAAPEAYTLLFENEKVRVMEVSLKPGQKAPMHNHPSSHIVYVTKDAKFKLSFPDGKNQEIDLKAGKAVWMPAGQHETENVGKTDGLNVVIEVK